MIIVLCLINYLLILFSVYIFCVKNGTISLNGFFFFSVGYAYYWLTPYFLSSLLGSTPPEELQIVIERFVSITDETSLIYLLLSFLFYAIFLFFYYVSFNGKSSRKPISQKSERAIRFWSIMSCLGIGLAALMAIPIKHYFFTGYDAALFENYQDGVVQDALPRGTFIASTSILFSMAFMRAVMKHGHLQKILPVLTDPFMLAYYFFAILALSLGGRLYFATNMLTVIIFFSTYFSWRVKLSEFFVLGLAGIGSAAMWGVLRAGSDFSLFNMALNLAQEPLLTSISSFSFLTSGKLPLINFPSFLISDFINLIPSVIFPGKINYLLNPLDFGYDFAMPLGGLHVFVSLLINFGIAGAAVFFAAVGYLMGNYRKTVSIQKIVIYSLICACMTFTFNRDPFSVSIVKNIFENSFLIPFILYSIQKKFFK